MLRTVLVLFFMYIGGAAALADTCVPQSQVCNTRGNIIVGGVTLVDVCLEVFATDDCVRSEPLNNCTGLEPLEVDSSVVPLGDGQCHLVSEVCVQSDGGQCNKFERTYSCWNGPGEIADATLAARDFVNLSETLPDNCSAIVADANCVLESEVITQGAETRTINYLDFTRGFWEKQRTYNCTNPDYVSTCGDYQNNPICTLVETPVCLAYDDDNNCEYEERLYECDAQGAFQASCENINVCIGDNCSGVEQEPSDQYPNAAVWLTFLDTAAKKHNCEVDPEADLEELSTEDCVDPDADTDLEQPKLFSGSAMSCDADLGKNCCSDPSNSFCRPDEQILKDKSDAGVTHYIGSQCTYYFLGWCLTTTYSFCTYETKFGRVFQKEVHKQTNNQFHYLSGNPCPPLTIEDLENVDVTQMDLSEVFADMLDKTDTPVEELLVQELSSQMGVFSTDVQDNLE